MTEPIQTENKPAARPLRCDEWEALLADGIDGTLSAADQAAFQSHSENCKACSTTLEETRKGQQWLKFLHVEPAVPGDLLSRILASTSGTKVGVAVPGEVMDIPLQIVPLPPLWKRVSLSGMIRRAGEPRMMMTAAMAFFSIALTLNLTGVHLSAVSLSDLKPNTLQTNIRRSYISANARVTRYYDNLRVVYEVESRMREMQRTSEQDQPAPQKQEEKKTGGAAGKTPAPGGKSQSPRNNGNRAYLPGREELASIENGTTITGAAAAVVADHGENRGENTGENRRLASTDLKERIWV